MVSPKLKVRLFVDTEADFYYLAPSPHFKKKDIVKWNLNKIAGKVYRYPWPSRKGVINLMESFKEHAFPAIFCITGHLYLKECDGEYHFGIRKPENPWYYKIIGKNWYDWDKGGNYKTHPGRYLGDIIEKEAKNPLFKFGIHGFAHEALTLESREVIDSIVATAKKAAEATGVMVEYFASPFELTEDESDPDKLYEILRKYKIKNVFYSGTDKGLEIKRYFAVKSVIKENGVSKLWISNYFEGTSSEKKLDEIFADIRKHKHEDAVYHLGTHDFTHANKKNVNKVIQFLKKEGFTS